MSCIQHILYTYSNLPLMEKVWEPVITVNLNIHEMCGWLVCPHYRCPAKHQRASSSGSVTLLRRKRLAWGCQLFIVVQHIMHHLPDLFICKVILPSAFNWIILIVVFLQLSFNSLVTGWYISMPCAYSRVLLIWIHFATVLLYLRSMCCSIHHTVCIY